MADYFGLFAAPAQLKGRASQDFSMPVVGASSLLDSPWLDAMLNPSACQQSQVVPDVAADAIELDLAGLEQHIHAAAAAAADIASSPSMQWSAEDFGDLLQQQPSCSGHALGSFDGADSLAATAALLGSQQEAPLFAAAAFEGPLPADSSASHQQQQVPDMPQWVPTATQQEQTAPASAPAPAGFVWPCPQELRRLDTSTLTAATAFAAVFPATPAAAAATVAAAPATSLPTSAGQPHAQAAMTAAADSAGSGTAPAVRPKAWAAAKARAAGSSRVQQVLGPAVRTRAEAVARYKAKRARRSSVNRVRYQRRKDYADQRPRVGGRFVKVKGVQQQQQPHQQQQQGQAQTQLAL